MKLSYFCLFVILLTIIITAQEKWYWQNPTPPQTYILNKVKCIDENRWIVVGEEGIIYITTNGGYTWGPIESGTEYDLIDLYFLNAYYGITITYGAALITFDGGWTWASIYPPFGSYYSCWLKDSLHIYIST